MTLVHLDPNADPSVMTPEASMFSRVLARALAAILLGIIPGAIASGAAFFGLRLLDVNADAGIFIIGPAVASVLLLSWIVVLKEEGLERERLRLRGPTHSGAAKPADEPERLFPRLLK